jgi:Protein of unknown function (DUF3105)
MAKRRTSGIQRRSRASDEAMSRRLRSGGLGVDWRLLVVGGVLVIGAIVVVLVLALGGGGSQLGIGTHQTDDGHAHIQEGTQGGPYSSIPATSGPHWSSATAPGPWGVYNTAQPQERLLHNLEHGGIVIWYQTSKTTAADLTALTTFVQQQVTTEQFKVILAPWSGADFGHPIAATAWDWLLYLDSADTDALRTFIGAHYEQSPEPLGGPAKPGS